MRQTVTLGKLTLSIQSFIVAVVGLVISVLLSFLVHPIAGAMSLLTFFMAAYNVNCVVVGKCVQWAWALVVVYGLYLVFVLGSLAFGVANSASLMSNVSKTTNVRRMYRTKM
jgi:hypothetical protein